jgi:short subunit dehydrogenase-like uncharacterized protein
MIYGASGYTGRLIAREAVRRGLQPVLAGRNREAIESLGAELLCPVRVFPLEHVDEIVKQIAGLQVVLNCAGPFSATAVPMMEACLWIGCHYLDITGEIDVIEAAAARDDRAKKMNVTLLPAVGFDVVPSDCLARMLSEKLPEATHLLLAFSGTGGVSPGTAKTMLENAPGGGRARIDGRITRVPTNWKEREVPFRHGPRHAKAIPWGDVASAWHSTHIPNIETYVSMTRTQARLMRTLSWLTVFLRFEFFRRLARQRIEKAIAGPSDAEREASRASFWGQASDAKGNSVTATLETPGGYQLTMLTAVTCLQRILAGGVPTGFQTPSTAFGKELILTIPGVELAGPI